MSNFAHRIPRALNLACVALVAASAAGCSTFSKPAVDDGNWAERYDDAVPVQALAVPFTESPGSAVPPAADLPPPLVTGISVPGYPRSNEEKAEFYWHYAALAASIYGTEGLEDTSLLLAVSSPYLRKEVERRGDERVAADYRRVNAMNDAETYKWLQLRCDGNKVTGHAVHLCNVYHRHRHALRQLLPDDSAKMKDEVPRQKTSLPVAPDSSPSNKADDCRDPNPKVPLSVAISKMGWERVKEIDKYTIGRGWRVFVPDLAIDVWRRTRAEFEGDNAVEYAIVFRGTVGSGGWMSNFRILTGMVPVIFWDQYLQAESATLKIVEQIYMLHSVRDSLMPDAPRSRILITAVGHSLGAGLASFVHYRIPAITRVVGFNPTPIDGSRSLVSLPERDTFHAQREGLEPLDVDAPLRRLRNGFERTSMYLVYEKGEVLSRLDSCDSGPVWGREGGPTALCERVNLSSGSIFAQHSMPQFACKLALEAKIMERPGDKDPALSAAR